jgi:hypothetical protein
VTGFTKNSRTVHDFWKLIHTLDNEMRARVLQFATGTSRVPMNGFAQLHGSNGPRKFTLSRFDDDGRLPMAHTCFNRIDLRDYKNYEVLRKKLLQAVEFGSGFGGVD